jgi:SAM-dependent methyltransferase
LTRILAEWNIGPSRVLELGCGTGNNAVYLAQRGFDVTAFDLASLAVEAARARAAAARVEIRLLQADALELPDLGTFPFVFDRGLYHVMRRTNLERFLRTLARVCQPGGWYLTLAGNANDPHVGEPGPPRARAEELCHELESLFELVQLREFVFDGAPIAGRDARPLAWSALLRRRKS